MVEDWWGEKADAKKKHNFQIGFKWRTYSQSKYS